MQLDVSICVSLISIRNKPTQCNCWFGDLRIAKIQILYPFSFQSCSLLLLQSVWEDLSVESLAFWWIHHKKLFYVLYKSLIGNLRKILVGFLPSVYIVLFLRVDTTASFQILPLTFRILFLQGSDHFSLNGYNSTICFMKLSWMLDLLAYKKQYCSIHRWGPKKIRIPEAWIFLAKSIKKSIVNMSGSLSWSTLARIWVLTIIKIICKFRQQRLTTF